MSTGQEGKQMIIEKHTISFLEIWKKTRDEMRTSPKEEGRTATIDFLLRAPRVLMQIVREKNPEADIVEINVLGFKVVKIRQSFKSITDAFHDPNNHPKPLAIHALTNGVLGPGEPNFGLTAPSPNLKGREIIEGKDYQEFENQINPLITQMNFSPGCTEYIEKSKMNLFDLSTARRTILAGLLGSLTGRSVFFNEQANKNDRTIVDVNIQLDKILALVDNGIGSLTSELLKATVVNPTEEQARKRANKSMFDYVKEKVNQVWDIVCKDGITPKSPLDSMQLIYNKVEMPKLLYLLIEAGVGSTALLLLNSLNQLSIIQNIGSKISDKELNDLIYVSAFINPPIDLTIREEFDGTNELFNISGAADTLTSNYDPEFDGVFKSQDEINEFYKFLDSNGYKNFPWLKFSNMTTTIASNAGVDPRDIRQVVAYLIRNCSGQMPAINAVQASIRAIESSYNIVIAETKPGKHVSSSSGPVIIVMLSRNQEEQ